MHIHLSPKTKTQILRFARIGGLGLLGGALPVLAGMHGNLTIVGLQAAAVAAGEGLYRAIFPVVEEAFLTTTSPVPQPAQDLGKAPAAPVVPPAVF